MLKSPPPICEALPTFAQKLLPLGGLRAADTYLAYAPEYSLQNVPSMRSIKCWTDGVRHVPTVLVERVPVSKYVLVLLGF